MRPKERRRVARPRASTTWQNIAPYVLGGVALLLVTGFLYGVRQVTSINSLQIKSISVSGGETVSHTLVRETAWSALAGSYAKIVPHTFTYWYPEERMYALLHDIPRVKDVQIEHVSRTSLTVTFTEYLPYALWCSGVESTSTCLFMDDAAFAYGDAPQVHGARFIRYVDVATGPQKWTASPFAERMSRVEEFQTKLHEIAPFTIHSVMYGTYGDVVYYLTNGGQLRTRESDNPQSLVTTLTTLLSHKKYSHLVADPFLYIDMRFGSRVYVKEKEVEEPSSAEEVATTTEEL